MDEEKKPVGRPEKLTVKDVEDMLHETHGAITITAEQLEVAYNTVRRIMDKDENAHLWDIVYFYRERKVDMAELALENKLIAGDNWAIGMVLTTLGKDRGYVRRQEIAGVGDAPLNINFTWDTGSEDDAGNEND